MTQHIFTQYVGRTVLVMSLKFAVCCPVFVWPFAADSRNILRRQRPQGTAFTAKDAVSYVESNLIPGKKVPYKSRLHWVALLAPFLVGALQLSKSTIAASRRHVENENLETEMADTLTRPAGRHLTDLAACCGRVAKDFPHLAGETGKLVKDYRKLQRRKATAPSLKELEAIKTEEESLKAQMIDLLARCGH